MRECYRFLKERGLATEIPTNGLQRMPESRQLGSTLSVEELRAMYFASHDPVDRALVALLGFNSLDKDEVVDSRIGHLDTLSRYSILRLPKRAKPGEVPYTVLPALALGPIQEVVGDRISGPLLVRNGLGLTLNQVAYAVKRIARRAGLNPETTPKTLKLSLRRIAVERGFSHVSVVYSLGDQATANLADWVSRSDLPLGQHAAIRIARLVENQPLATENLLQQAEILLHQSDLPPAVAAGLAGAALEKHLRELCVKKNVSVPKTPTLTGILSALRQAKVVRESDVQLGALLTPHRDNAAHGWFEKVSEDEAIGLCASLGRSRAGTPDSNPWPGWSSRVGPQGLLARG